MAEGAGAFTSWTFFRDALVVARCSTSAHCSLASSS